MTDKNCDETVARLADWIQKAHLGEESQLAAKVASYEARERAADELIGQYYGTMPDFTRLCNEVADGTDIRIRRSAVRDALRCISGRLASVKREAPIASSSMRELVGGAA